MRLLLQRVSSAQVSVAGDVIGEIQEGLLVFVCAMIGDTDAIAQKMARKVARLRVFNDEHGKMNLSLGQVSGEVLVVSQFTLAADTRRGQRPGFSRAMMPSAAQELCEAVARSLADEGVVVRMGRFGADMAVKLVNDGPVTVWLDSAE
ncbi:MAG TPA: D-tyrosyl-tRNA(Tyr) deacylase [Gammaproteobacteria bacterium]|jgi:D-tyrosyl-tRNA(Tyr) deacylase|nr:D-tyrosyl-tRNA(Tyr) deacylase [Gammaproteobacteria bacterium]|tara:strand:- start:547 stop:990 length:444 start_codon:yes stop_codon:yes gene_type:complete